MSLLLTVCRTTLLVVLQVTGEGVLVAFNPITGEGVGEGGGVMPLGYTLIQALLLHHPDHQYLKVGWCTGDFILL